MSTFRVLPYSNYSRIVDHHNDQLHWSKIEGNGSSNVSGNTQTQSKNGGNVSSRWIWSKTLIPDSLKHFEAQDHDTRKVSTHWIQRYWLKDAGHNKSINNTRLLGDCGLARYDQRKYMMIYQIKDCDLIQFWSFEGCKQKMLHCGIFFQFCKSFLVP